MKIFIINGKGGSGKDSFINFLTEEFSNDYKILNYSTVDPVKQFARVIGWDEEKNSKGRRLISELKRIMTEYNDLPMREIIHTVNITEKLYGKDNPYVIIFIHCREPNEIDRLKEALLAETILIERESLKNKDFGNSSDNDVYNYYYDYVIDNNGSLEDLKDATIKFMEEIR